MKAFIIAAVMGFTATQASAEVCWVNKVYRHGDEVRVHFISGEPDGVIVWHAANPKGRDEFGNDNNRFFRNDAHDKRTGEGFDGLPLAVGDRAYAFTPSDYEGCVLRAVVLKGQLGVLASDFLGANDMGEHAPMVAFYPAVEEPPKGAGN